MSGIINFPLLLLGATGIMGRGVLAAAVEAGRSVIAVADDTRELNALAESHPGAEIVALSGSLHTDAAGAELAAAVRALHRPLIGVIAAFSGAPGRGRLLDHPVQTLQHQLDHDLLPHLVAARHLLPLLADDNRGGGYVLIGGPGGELPWAGYGHRSVAAAAQRMLARALHDEARALAVRVQLLAVDLPMQEECHAQACPHWPSAREIGRHALALAERRDGDSTPAPVVTYSARLGAISSTAEVVAANASSRVAPLLPARCLLDARQLLQSLVPLRSRNPNQDSPP